MTELAQGSKVVQNVRPAVGGDGEVMVGFRSKDEDGDVLFISSALVLMSSQNSRTSHATSGTETSLNYRVNRGMDNNRRKDCGRVKAADRWKKTLVWPPLKSDTTWTLQAYCRCNVDKASKSRSVMIPRRFR